MRYGRIETVWVERYGCNLVADAAIGATVLSVSLTADLDEAGGQLQHVETGTILDYTTIDPDAETVTLTSPLAAALSDGDTLRVYPLSDDLFASVRLDDAAADEEPIEARVAQSLRTVVAEGVRDGEREQVRVEDTGTEWVVTDVVGTAPVINGSYIDPDTVPQPRDGLAPDSSPAPTVQGGIGVLFVKWDGVDNNDPVTYEVHLSASSGLTPSTATLATETNGTMVSLRTLPDGSALAYGTTYYVKIIAKDLDGSAAASAEASGQMVQANSPDIATNSVTTDQLAANSVQAENLDVIELTATKFYSPAQTGWRVEFGDQASPIRYWDGENVGFGLDHDPATNKANVAVSGRVSFGNSLLENDMAEFRAQSPGFLTPNRRQGTQKNFFNSGTSHSIAWPSSTVKGNLLLAVVTVRAASGVTAPTITASGWTLVATSTRGPLRTSLYSITNAAVRSGNETFTTNISAWRAMHLAEYSGIAMTSPLDQTATANGNSTTMSSGTTATTTQGEELWFAVHALDLAGGDWVGFSDPDNSFADIDTAFALDTLTDKYYASAMPASRNATATGAASTSRTLGAAKDWVGLVATFKAATGTGDPNPPATTSARLYAKARDSGFVELHSIDELGRTCRLGSGWNLLDQGAIPTTGMSLTNIPAWFQDLKLLIKGYVQNDTGPNARDITIRFNNEAGASSYTWFNKRWLDDGTNALGTSAAASLMDIGVLGINNSCVELTFFGYTRNAPVQCLAVGAYRSTPRIGVCQAQGHWSNPSSVAVTSIQIGLPSTFEFGTGSIYELYGLGIKPSV